MVFWSIGLVVGLVLTVFFSGRTLVAATTLAQHLGLSPFIVGLTVVAIGTDLPEIANSITASASGHGDINVGDSIGSVVTQITLVLGLLCFFRPIKTERRPIAVAGAVTVASLLVGAALLNDSYLQRRDGLLLLGVWIVGTVTVQRFAHVVSARQESLFTRGVFVSLRDLAIGLVGVAVGAVLVVRGFIEVADWLSVPEYASSFLVLSIGTSLPELVVDGRALRSGYSDLAMGDIVGSSFVDATVSLGIGPALFPVGVSAAAATGNLIAAAVVATAILLLLRRRTHGKRSGIYLLALYASAYAIVLL